MTDSRKSCGGLRSMARLCAVQAVYCTDITNCAIETIMTDSHSSLDEIFVTENFSISEMDRNFFLRLVKATGDNLLIIDEMISKNLSNNWEFNRLDSVMKSILRLGVAELLYFEDIPSNVVFNEYIEISKSFFAKNEVAFVNGLLNSIGKSCWR
jgi:N utilization substance protein B